MSEAVFALIGALVGYLVVSEVLWLRERRRRRKRRDNIERMRLRLDGWDR